MVTKCFFFLFILFTSLISSYSLYKNPLPLSHSLTIWLPSFTLFNLNFSLKLSYLLQWHPSPRRVHPFYWCNSSHLLEWSGKAKWVSFLELQITKPYFWGCKGSEFSFILPLLFLHLLTLVLTLSSFNSAYFAGTRGACLVYREPQAGGDRVFHETIWRWRCWWWWWWWWWW